jgi:hypothetical protein
VATQENKSGGGANAGGASGGASNGGASNGGASNGGASNGGTSGNGGASSGGSSGSGTGGSSGGGSTSYSVLQRGHDLYRRATFTAPDLTAAAVIRMAPNTTFNANATFPANGNLDNMGTGSVLYLQEGPTAAGCRANATGCAATARAAELGCSSRSQRSVRIRMSWRSTKRRARRLTAHVSRTATGSAARRSSIRRRARLYR